jgi:hypothetical protein
MHAHARPVLVELRELVKDSAPRWDYDPANDPPQIAIQQAVATAAKLLGCEMAHVIKPLLGRNSAASRRARVYVAMALREAFPKCTRGRLGTLINAPSINYIGNTYTNWRAGYYDKWWRGGWYKQILTAARRSR